MSNEISLDGLEQDVLLRIRRHRQHSGAPTALPIGAVLAACALIVGLGVGVITAQHRPMVWGSETVVLGDDALLTPSSLLAPAGVLTSGM
jgi:hypothetical protein